MTVMIFFFFYFFQLGNHDQKRLASRLGERRVDLFNILLKTLPGISITYQVRVEKFKSWQKQKNLSILCVFLPKGEEIGMTDVIISWEDSVDPPACNSNETTYYSVTRDPGISSVFPSPCYVFLIVNKSLLHFLQFQLHFAQN